MFSNWVTGGGRLIAMRPDKKLASLLGVSAQTGTLADAYLRIDTSKAPGAGLVDDTIQFHGTSDQYLAVEAGTVATLHSDATHPTSLSRGDVESGRVVGRAGSGVHLRPGAIGRLHATGQSRVGRPGTRRVHADPLRRPVLRREVGRRSTRLDRSEQSADSAGRRTATAPREPDSADDRQAGPALLVLPEREEGGRDHDRRRSRERRHRQPLHAVSSQSPAGCNVANWDCIRSTSYVYPGTPLDEHAGDDLHESGV